MYKNIRPVVDGVVAASLVLGMLILAGALAPSAYARSSCPDAIAGTQAYAECMTRAQDPGASDTDAAPQPPEIATTDGAVGSAAAWQLLAAGVIGVLVGMGALLAGRTALQHRHVHAAP